MTLDYTWAIFYSTHLLKDLLDLHNIFVGGFKNVNKIVMQVPTTFASLELNGLRVQEQRLPCVKKIT